MKHEVRILHDDCLVAVTTHDNGLKAEENFDLMLAVYKTLQRGRLYKHVTVLLCLEDGTTLEQAHVHANHPREDPCA